MKAERRFMQSEVRATDGDSPKIAGYAALFNVRSQDLGGFIEIIAPGAFDACLASSPDILALYNHDMDALPLGRTTSGTLRVSVDNVGLSYEVDPADTQPTRDLMVSLRRKDVTGSSFGFYTLEDSWDLLDDDTLLRTLRKVSVFDVSPVNSPAYLQTNAAVRGLLPSADAELRALATSKRAALKVLPEDVAREESTRMELLLHLAGC